MEKNKINRYRYGTYIIAFFYAIISISIQKSTIEIILVIAIITVIPFVINAELLIFHLKKLASKNGSYTVAPFVNVLIIITPIIGLVILKVPKQLLYTYIIALAISRVVDQIMRIIAFKEKPSNVE